MQNRQEEAPLRDEHNKTKQGYMHILIEKHAEVARIQIARGQLFTILSCANILAHATFDIFIESSLAVFFYDENSFSPIPCILHFLT